MSAALAPSDGGIRRDLGIALLHTSQNTAARKELEEAVHLIPKDPDAWFYCGIARGRIGKENDAANALRQALKLNPNHAAALLDLGKLDAIAMGHYPTPPRWLTNEALSSLRRCVKLQPTDPETWYSLALAEGAAKQTKQSILDMSRSIQLKGDVGGAWIYRAEQREVAGEPDAEVESDAKRGLALDPNNSTGWAIVGRVEARAGKLNEAISSFTRAIQFSPTRLLSKDSLYRRAQAELQLGQKTAGNRDMNERARLDQLEAHIRALVVSPRPGDATYYQQLAQLYAAAGDHGLEARARRAAAELGKRQ